MTHSIATFPAGRAARGGERAGDPPPQDAAQSWQMDNRAETMVAGMFDVGFGMGWMRKDRAIGLAGARKNRAAIGNQIRDEYCRTVRGNPMK